MKLVFPDYRAIVAWTVRLDIRGHRARRENPRMAVMVIRASRASPVNLVCLGVQETLEEKDLLVHLEHRVYQGMM